MLQRLNNMRWELQLGIATRGRERAFLMKPDAVHYATIDYAAIRSVLQQLVLLPSDIFVDIGCGKGRVLCCAAKHPCKAVVGVEYDALFCSAAWVNAQQLRGRHAPISIHHGAAEAFDYSGATVLYLFNPFGPQTLDAVLHKIHADTGYRPLRLAFVSPPEALGTMAAVFAEHRWLVPYDGRPLGANGSVLFYRKR